MSGPGRERGDSVATAWRYHLAWQPGVVEPLLIGRFPPALGPTSESRRVKCPISTKSTPRAAQRAESRMRRALKGRSRGRRHSWGRSWRHSRRRSWGHTRRHRGHSSPSPPPTPHGRGLHLIAAPKAARAKRAPRAANMALTSWCSLETTMCLGRLAKTFLSSDSSRAV